MLVEYIVKKGFTDILGRHYKKGVIISGITDKNFIEPLLKNGYIKKNIINKPKLYRKSVSVIDTSLLKRADSKDRNKKEGKEI